MGASFADLDQDGMFDIYVAGNGNNSFSLARMTAGSNPVHGDAILRNPSNGMEVRLPSTMTDWST